MANGYKKIYTKVLKSCVEFSVYGTKTAEEESKKILPVLNEFYNQVFKENVFNIEKTDYEQLQILFVNIIRDFHKDYKIRMQFCWKIPWNMDYCLFLKFL